MTDGIPELPTAPPPPPAEPKSWIDAMPHNWLALAPEHGNCDQLPAWLTPATGCPDCGSVWTEVRNVAYSRDCTRGEFLEASWHVRQIGGVEPVMAVRLGCCEGHIVEYDGVRLKVIPPLPTWWSATLTTAVLGIVGVYGMMFARRK